MKSLNGLLLLASLLALPVSAALGQSTDLPEPGQMGLDVSNVMQANDAALAGYTWKNTLEVSKDGETASTTVNQIKIADGKPVAMLISHEADGEHTKGLRGKKQKKETEFVEGAVELTARYAAPSTGSLVDFFQRATFALGAGKMEGYVQAQGSGLVNDTDKVTMWVDGTTFKPFQTGYSTEFDGNPISGTVTYADASDGKLFYVANNTFTIADKSLTIVSTNSDLEVAVVATSAEADAATTSESAGK